MKKENKKSLGFIFGFKETISNEDNSFTVSFKTGISNKFPSKYSNKKDFWSEEIKEGQVSNIYINPEVFKEAYNKEIEDISKDKFFHEEQYNKRKYFFDYKIKKEQYNALTAFSMAHLHINVYEKWENDSTITKTLEETIGQYFSTENRDIKEIYNNYQETSLMIYEKETSEALSYISTEEKKKPSLK